MKKFSTVLIIVLFVAGVVLAFFAGDYMSNKAHMENRAEEFNKYISLAIDTVEDKGLAIEGATETIASNIWVAHAVPSSKMLRAETLIAAVVFAKMLLKPRFGTRLAIGIWPPSKPGRCPWPARAF